MIYEIQIFVIQQPCKVKGLPCTPFLQWNIKKYNASVKVFEDRMWHVKIMSSFISFATEMTPNIFILLQNGAVKTQKNCQRLQSLKCCYILILMVML